MKTIAQFTTGREPTDDEFAEVCAQAFYCEVKKAFNGDAVKMKMAVRDYAENGDEKDDEPWTKMVKIKLQEMVGIGP